MQVEAGGGLREVGGVRKEWEGGGGESAGRWG